MAPRNSKSSKSSAGSKSSASKGSSRNSSRSKKAPQTEYSNAFQTEIILLIVLTASVIFMISVLGFGGIVGNMISNLLFGAIGYLAYIFPILFFIGIAFLLSNHSSRLAFRKVLASLIFFVFLCGLVQIITEGYLPGNDLMDYYHLSSLYKTGGGITGGAVCFSSMTAFGKIGGIVIMVLVLFICLIIMTQRSFFGFVEKAANAFTGSMERRREEYVQSEPERQLKREQKEIHRQNLREERRQMRMRELEESIEEEKRRGEENSRKEKEAAERRAVEAAALSTARKKKDEASVSAEILDDSTSMDGINVDHLQIQEEDTGFLAGTWLERREPSRKKTAPFVEDPITLTQEPMEVRPLKKAPESEQEPFPEEPAAEVPAIPEQENSSAANDHMPSFTIMRGDVPTSTEDFPNAEELSEDLPEESEEDPYTDSEIPSFGLAAENTSEDGEKSHRNPRSSAQEISDGITNVASEIQQQSLQQPKIYHYPPLSLLKKGDGRSQGDSDEHLQETAKKLQDTLYNFGVNAKVINVSCGPTVTRFELQPEMGVKVSKIVGLSDDIKLNLATTDIRIEAPIPGKAAVGIEVPNKENSSVSLRDLLEASEFQNAKSKLAFAAGKDIAGKPVVTDIAKMPHLLIAGATGSGKSVCINTLIMSILYKAKPDEVKLIMIDPKVVELSVYNGIPHLLIPVVTDPKKAAGALNWAVTEMTNRYNTFAEYSVRNISEYNRKIENMAPAPEGEIQPQRLPQIVVIVDELADLMMVAPGEVEDAICRLAQLARAAGIHLIIATQRPSVNVITGLIKANMPSRIAFSVSSGVDSRTILDMNGAEKLLGKGDMLFYPQGYQKPARLQGAFVSDEEVSAVVDFLTSKNPKSDYDQQIEQQVAVAAIPTASSLAEDQDVYFAEAGRFIIEKDKASIGMLQRMFKIGFNRAARIMDQLCDAGVVGPEEGTKPRNVLMSQEQFESYLEEHG